MKKTPTLCQPSEGAGQRPGWGRGRRAMGERAHREADTDLCRLRRQTRGDGQRPGSREASDSRIRTLRVREPHRRLLVLSWVVRGKGGGLGWHRERWSTLAAASTRRSPPSLGPAPALALDPRPAQPPRLSFPPSFDHASIPPARSSLEQLIPRHPVEPSLWHQDSRLSPRAPPPSFPAPGAQPSPSESLVETTTPRPSSQGRPPAPQSLDADQR